MKGKGDLKSVGFYPAFSLVEIYTSMLNVDTGDGELLRRIAVVCKLPMSNSHSIYLI